MGNALGFNRNRPPAGAPYRPRSPSVDEQLLDQIQQQDDALEEAYPTKTNADLLEDEDQPLINSEVIGLKATRALKREGVVINTKRFIGSGSFGVIYAAKVNGQEAAVKVFDINQLVAKNRRSFLKNFPRELAIIKRLDHPNIVATLRIYLQLGTGRVYIFMERADSDLAQYCMNRGRALPEGEIKKIFSQIASGLNYMHSNLWSHRDVKLLNCLVFGNQRQPNILVKLTDFGFTRSVLDEVDMSQTFNVYTASHRPPEVLLKVPYSPLLGDVWCLGVVLFCLANCRRPFEDPDVVLGNKPLAQTDFNLILQQQLARAYVWKDPGKWSPEIKDLVAGMLEPSVESRLTMPLVMAHKWLQRHRPVVAAVPLSGLSPLANFPNLTLR